MVTLLTIPAHSVILMFTKELHVLLNAHKDMIRMISINASNAQLDVLLAI